MVEEAGEDFEGDGLLQVGGRDAAGLRDDFGDHGQSQSSLTTSPSSLGSSRLILASGRALTSPADLEAFDRNRNSKHRRLERRRQILVDHREPAGDLFRLAVGVDGRLFDHCLEPRLADAARFLAHRSPVVRRRITSRRHRIQIAQFVGEDSHRLQLVDGFSPCQRHVPVGIAIEERECLDDNGNRRVQFGACSMQQVPLLSRLRMQRVPKERKRDPPSAVDKNRFSLAHQGSS